ncbi:diaminobutyrate--2-oxoglutarate transaminase [Desmospora profundinema]|uniref:Diaminobutyrate--2-oxoglutarate transaminase n=1 Tax=Desmospora profundinema TaxID=1571184 RepID=A0ABU1IPT3_9BACL|nr:diaminobutyrate--2-oxoglutarate transaminase [Desmospora profundinema]MDR6226413.1 diaminobutyrate-2-oxoglutarate transaminase [Desmospora profundinema]
MQPNHALGNDHYLANQERRESNARSYPRRIPIAIRKANGIHVTDVEGNVHFDCLSGAGTLALGHNHPVVVEAIQRVLADSTPLHTLDLTTPVKDEFMEELLSCLPPAFSSRAKIQFCGPSGADAVEAALKLVKTATQRRSILSFHGAYHGMTHGALGLTGNIAPKQRVAGLMADVHFLPYPYSYRCPFGQGDAAGTETGSRFIQRVLEDPESGIVAPAGMIMEVVQGEGGVIPAPDQWVRNIRSLTREHNIPLIIDEVQTGFGRTGRWFAFEHANITPDVLVLSKAIGGSLPLAVVVYDESLDAWLPGAHSGTFRGNQMAMAAGTATIRYIRENRLDAHAASMGERFLSRLAQIKRGTSCIGDVRGRGLMIGVEIVHSGQEPDSLGSHPPHPELARKIQKACMDRRLIVELGGRHGSVVRFLPPLTIQEEQVDQVCQIFADAVESVEKTTATYV